MWQVGIPLWHMWALKLVVTSGFSIVTSLSFEVSIVPPPLQKAIFGISWIMPCCMVVVHARPTDDRLLFKSRAWLIYSWSIQTRGVRNLIEIPPSKKYVCVHMLEVHSFLQVTSYKLHEVIIVCFKMVKDHEKPIQIQLRSI